MKIIHYYSLLFIRVLNPSAASQVPGKYCASGSIHPHLHTLPALTEAACYAKCGPMFFPTLLSFIIFYSNFWLTFGKL